jgi:hypothetical protein
VGNGLARRWGYGIDIFFETFRQNTGFKGLAGFGYGVIRPKY